MRNSQAVNVFFYFHTVTVIAAHNQLQYEIDFTYAMLHLSFFYYLLVLFKFLKMEFAEFN